MDHFIKKDESLLQYNHNQTACSNIKSNDWFDFSKDKFC